MLTYFIINSISLIVGVTLGIFLVANFKDFFLKFKILDKANF